MDLFLLHSLGLLWASLGAARNLTKNQAELALTAGLLAWSNLVLTSLLLSGLHRLGEPLWFLGTSALLAAAAGALASRLTAEPAGAPADPSGPVKPLARVAFWLTVIYVAGAALQLTAGSVPSSHDDFAYGLPRVIYYLGQNTLLPFETGDLRQVWLPFNSSLLSLFPLLYDVPVSVLTGFSLLAWGLCLLAMHRLCRLLALGAGPALLATWLALIVSAALLRAMAARPDLPALAALLCVPVFLLRWNQTGLVRHAGLAGLAAGLAAGSQLLLTLLLPLAGGLLLLAGYRRRRGAPPSAGTAPTRAGLALWLPGLLLGLPFVLINFAAAGRWTPPATPLPWLAPSPLSPPATTRNLPLLIPYRLAPHKLLHIDSDAGDEEIYPLLSLAQGQRFIAGPGSDPGRYSVFSRAQASRNAAYQNLAQRPSYTLIPIPGKRTAGVEFLGMNGRGETGRDYFGLEPQAGQGAPIDGNRNLLLTLYHVPGGSEPGADTLIRLAGLNREDHARLAVNVERLDGSIARLATMNTDGDVLVPLGGPSVRLVFRVFDDQTGSEIGATTIPYRPLSVQEARPVDPSLPTSARSIFVIDLVLSQNSRPLTVEGLLPVEGPFPQWNLPFLRWARQPAVRIALPPNAQFAQLQLSFSVRLHVRNKAALDVRFNGRLVQRYRIEGRETWLDQTLELTPQPGENVLEFRDGPCNEEPDWLDYLERYPDVKKNVTDNHVPPEQGAREHFEKYGRAEGRTLQTMAKPEPAPEGYYFMFRNIRLEEFKSP